MGVYLFLNAKKVSRVRYYVCVCDMPGQKRDIMKRKMSVFVCLSFSLSIVQGRGSFRTRAIIPILVLNLNLILNLARATLHLRIANRVGEGSCCRGGIVHIRGGCSCALLVRRPRPKALWRFRVSISNSPSGRTLPHTDTHMC